MHLFRARWHLARRDLYNGHRAPRKERKQLLSQAMSLITDESPAQFLWRHQLTDGVSKKIDYKPRPDLRVFGLNIKVLK